jgi:hypothetical protein
MSPDRHRRGQRYLSPPSNLRRGSRNDGLGIPIESASDTGEDDDMSLVAGSFQPFSGGLSDHGDYALSVQSPNAFFTQGECRRLLYLHFIPLSCRRTRIAL